MNLPQHSPVIIVGAGPSGLMMAAQLLRQGIHPIIIDAKQGPNTQSRALAVQARSLEIFRQLGLHDRFIGDGTIVDDVIIHQGVEEIGRLDIAEMGKGTSPFPYVLMLEQSKTERILLDYLTLNSCPVFWNSELLQVDQTEQRCFLKIRCNQEEVNISSDWVVGADGAGSLTRKSLNIDFTGGSYENQFFLADIILPEDGSPAIHIFLKDNSFSALFPICNNKFRFVSMLPKSLKNKQGVRFSDVIPWLSNSFGFNISEDQCTWFSTYKLHHRMAARFMAGRCFLVGDAAHIHSPLGGQGMNTGLQDAYNLAWKLAAVMKGEFTHKILSSYPAERVPVARQLLNKPDKIFSFIADTNWLATKVRKIFFPVLLRMVWKKIQLTETGFSAVSQIKIGYRKSPLSVHHSQAKHIQAGDRVPFLKFYDEKLQEETDLHSWCSKAGFTLLILGNLSTRNLLAVAKWIKLHYPLSLNFYFLPRTKRNHHVFEAFEVKENRRKAIIIRPDMHIGYINDLVDTDLIEGYLKEVSGH